MKSKEIQDKIDLYLLGQLDEDKKKEFEDELATNTELKEKVAIQKLNFEEVKTRADFKKAIPKPTVTKFLHVMKITLSIAAVFFGVFFINKTVVNSRMDNMFAVNFAMLEVESKRGDEMLRGNDAKLVKQFFLAIDLLQIEKLNKPMKSCFNYIVLRLILNITKMYAGIWLYHSLNFIKKQKLKNT